MEIEEYEADGEEPEEWLVEDLAAAEKQVVQLRDSLEQLASIEKVFPDGGAGWSGPVSSWPIQEPPRSARNHTHDPSLYIPGLTPARQGAMLGEQVDMEYGGRLGMRITAASVSGDQSPLSADTTSTP